MADDENHIKIIEETFFTLTEHFLKNGATYRELKLVCLKTNHAEEQKEVATNNIQYLRKSFVALVILLFSSCCLRYSYIDEVIRSFYGTKCFVPNNYFVWEFTRPVSNCDYCRTVESALILSNLTKDTFKPYAYSSKPIIIKNAANHWEASKIFNLKYFHNLYENINGAYESIEEECQFLHFKSNFTSLKDVFAMTDDRANNKDGKHPWYVGWKNCHPQVLEHMKQFYEPPNFLPDDAEIPQTNYIFLGYDQGAIMHLDYIPRLMWQGQILGSKIWTVAPTPECDYICKPFNFTVDTGDIILLDTRIWYHGTYVENGKFSLTLTSEYG
ncbi:uncharacterized protein [Prorops nasuta]|uniref:uncharacterized protein n=1 Tax=Prorops nasuta TaxID=863751 RepID=UPI0034CF53AC